MIVIAISITVQSFLRNHPRIIEFVAIAVPFAFFWIRVSVGISHILQNGCNQLLRALQFGLFGLAILFLVLFEFIFIVAPPQQLFARGEGRLMIGMFSITYFMIMIFAWYPGRRRDAKLMR